MPLIRYLVRNLGTFAISFTLHVHCLGKTRGISFVELVGRGRKKGHFELRGKGGNEKEWIMDPKKDHGTEEEREKKKGLKRKQIIGIGENWTACLLRTIRKEDSLL